MANELEKVTPELVRIDEGEARVLGPKNIQPKVYKVSGVAALLLGLPLLAVFGLASLLVLAVILLVGALGLFGTLGSIRKQQRELNEKVRAECAEVPRIDPEHLPSYTKASGYLAKDFIQTVGKVEFHDQALHFQTTLGKTNVVPLEDVRSFKITAGLHTGTYFGKLNSGYKAVNLNLDNGHQLSFTVTSIEPWRSILSSVAEDRTMD